MAKVKIGKKEYIIPRLDYGDIKKIQRYKDESNIDNLDFDTYIMLATLQKANPELKDLTIQDFDKLLDIGEFERIKLEINDQSGFNKYIKKVEEKNLIPGVGKK